MVDFGVCRKRNVQHLRVSRRNSMLEQSSIVLHWPSQPVSNVRRHCNHPNPHAQNRHHCPQSQQEQIPTTPRARMQRGHLKQQSWQLFRRCPATRTREHTERVRTHRSNKPTHDMAAATHRNDLRISSAADQGGTNVQPPKYSCIHKSGPSLLPPVTYDTPRSVVRRTRPSISTRTSFNALMSTPPSARAATTAKFPSAAATIKGVVPPCTLPQHSRSRFKHKLSAAHNACVP